MKVACIQVDGKMPNLALMKLASYHQDLGHEVVLGIDGGADLVYISVVWPMNRPRALGISRLFPDAEVQIGGSGYGYAITLPDEVEHSMPAYDLWDVDFSLGFTSRGCIRRCPWCIVPSKEGDIRSHAPLSEFLHPSHKKVILLDNNLLAAPNCIDVLTDLGDRKIQVNYNQGLDVRLLDDEKANLLANTRYGNWKFTSNQVHFAFDELKYEAAVRKGIATLDDNGIPPRDVMVYILVDFNTTFKEDMARYKILWEELGAYPYVQVYNKSPASPPMLVKFQRWINTRIHKVVPWEKYDRLTPEEIEIYQSIIAEEVIP